MIRRSTWILLVVFIVLLGGTWYFQKYFKQGDAITNATPTPALTFLFQTDSAESIAGLQVIGPEGKTMTLVRAPDGTWFIQEASGQPADNVRVGPAITQVGTLRILSELELMPALEDLGLQPPQYQIILTMTDGEKQVAMIGDVTPIGSGYYTRREGGGVKVVNKFNLDSVLELYNNPPLPPTPTVEPAASENEVTATPQP